VLEGSKKKEKRLSLRKEVQKEIGQKGNQLVDRSRRKQRLILEPRLAIF
jgi:hypothetical protein